MRRFLALILALISCMLLVACSKNSDSDGARNIAKKYIDALKKGDIKSIMNLRHKDALAQDFDGEGELEAYIKKWEDENKLFNVKYSDIEIVEIEDLDESSWAFVQEKYKNFYGLEITAGKVVSIKYDKQIGEIVNKGNIMQFYVVQIGDNWYLD